MTKCSLPLSLTSHTNHDEKDDDDEEDKKEVEEDDDGVVQAGPWLRIMHTVLQVSRMPARI